MSHPVELLNLAFDNNKVAWWDWDYESGLVKFSPNKATMIGYSVEEFPTNVYKITELIHPDDYERTMTVMSQHLQSKTEFYEVAYRIKSKSNTYSYFYDYGKVIERTSAGKPKRLFGIVINIDIEREQEDRLRKLSQAVEQSPACVVITNVNGEIEYINPKFTEITGYTQEEVLGQNPRILKSGIQPDEFYKKLYDSINEGKEWKGKFQNKKKSGELYWAAACISAIKDEDGIIKHFLAIEEDVTEIQKSKELLIETKERYELAIDGSNDGIWDWDITSNLMFLSAKGKLQLGYEDHELSNDFSILESRIHPDDREVVLNNFQNYLAGRSPDYSIELRMLHKDGSYRWFLSRGKAIRNRDGEVIRMAGSHTDITERKELEKSLKHQSRLKDLLMEIATDFINIPLDKVDVAVNSALEKMAIYVDADRSYTFDYDWKNGVCNNIYEWCAPDITPEIANLQGVPLSMMPDWVEAHEKGEPMFVPDVFELPLGNAREILEPQGIKSVLTVPMMSNGLCVGFVGFDSVRRHHNYTVSDREILYVFAQMLANVKMRKEVISELLSAINKSEESQKRLKESQTIAKLGGWELDLKEGVFTFNDSFYALFHTNATEMGGYKMTPDDYAKRFLFPEDSYIIKSETERAIKADDPNYSSSFEHKIKYYDGGTGFISVKFFIVKNEDGETIKTYGVNQDITEKKERDLELIIAKERAEESNRLKTAFINNISHEIRTPINGILGFSQLMLQDNLTAADKLEYSKLLQQSSNRLMQTITNTMDISQVTAGTIKPEINSMHIGMSLSNLVEKIQSDCQKKSIQIIIDIPAGYEELLIDTDQKLFEKVMFHLLDNAQKFTNEGIITVGFEVDGTSIIFYVKDTGVGMTAEILEKIFNPFFQADTSSTRAYEGNGLGLPIAKGLVELLGGKISIESQEGKGTLARVVDLG